MLRERAAERGVKLPGKVASDPKDLGKVLTDIHEKPGQLRDILGLATPKRKRQDRTRSSTCCRHRPARQCSRASRPLSSSA